MTPELFLGILLLCFMVFGVPEDINKSKDVVTITAVKGTIEVKHKDEKTIELHEGETIELIND